SGKLDRKALPEPETGLVGDIRTAPGNDVQVTLVELWSDVLRRDKNNIGIDDDFFQSGGHSLKATILASEIHKALQVKVPLAEIFKSTTIRQLSDYIRQVSRDIHQDIEPVEEKEYYPLSPAQKRLYVIHRMDEIGTGYNMPSIFMLEGKLDKNRLGNTFNRLIKRHESLRTS
ncbi:MAG: hypothetical protein GY940_01685, partial [bacterium]|nr:hypothetical protein [bacterium]